MNKPINIDNAIRHLTNKFDETIHNRKSFRPSRYDIRCLNSIIEWRERDRKKQTGQNILFAKLYVYLFYQLTIYLKTNNMHDVAKWMGRIFNKPYSLLVQEFMMFADTYKEDLMLKEMGVPEMSSHIPALCSDEENETLRKSLEKLTPDKMEALLNTKWKYEDAIDFFDELISNALNVYSNAP